MARTLVFFILLVFLFGNLDSEVYQDRPKIKTVDGDLIFEPAYDKNIILRRNGPKSTIFVGDVNILDIKSKADSNIQQNQEKPYNNVQYFLNEPNQILQRLKETLELLESKAVPLPDDLYANVSTLWRKVNNLQRKVNNLQTQLNSRGQDECQSHPCQHGGTCLNLVKGYHCLCPNNWEGQDCDIDVNECRNFAGTDLGCQNGATCVNKPGYYECLCRSGWFGLHCTRKAKDCSGGDFEMCGHGTCVKVETGEGVACICHQGWTTNGTGVTCLTDVDECDPVQGTRCSINPKVDCINLPGSFRCGQCPPGYEGDGYSCSDIDECITFSNGGCSSLVSCHNTIGSRICGSCPSGYEGDGVTCVWKGLCNVDHGGCHPSAQCVENLSLGRTAQCMCPDGMDGDGVGIYGCYVAVSNNTTASCENNPCGLHGKCHIVRSGYTCICKKGYEGPHCDSPENLCAVNPCHNGGICRLDDSTTTGFRCECTAQYSGPSCQSRKTCGGMLDDQEGKIVYPLTNSSYQHNSKCAWVIHTIPSKVINITFSKFNLEEGNPDCPYDFLQIHDGQTSASQLIGRFCGDVFPKGGNILSSHNNIYFWFRSDNAVAKNGFALHWTSVDPMCGGSIDASTHGHISSPGSPGKYPPNRDCYWKLRAPFGKKIQLHFFALDIEHHANCNFDYLAIYDGSRETDPLLNQFCDSTQPAPITSAGSDILIHFHSDSYGAGFGFQLAYTSTPGVPGCGGYYTQERGELSAPMYDGTYLSNMICEYKIKTSPGSKIRIHFKDFSLERSTRCRFDYLKIYDGPSEESSLVGQFCGARYPKSFVASSNTLFFRFRSDAAISAGGFKILYETLCQQTLYGDSGVIKSPGYPFNYPENKVCEYFIATSPGKAIQLTFQDFDIEDNRYYDCQYDNVEIRDGIDAKSTLRGRFCGGSEHIPPVQYSTHNHMYIRFNSDTSLTGTGFYANYTTFVTECGGVFRETTGLINHPSGEGSYKNDQTCYWILLPPPGMHIKLTWHRFELEKTSSCGSDYLELIESDDDNANFTIGKFCGTNSPPALTTSASRLILKFESDHSVRTSGFSVSYTYLDEKSHCGGTYYRSHDIIYSPGWPQRYEQNRDCTWLITVPLGQQIRLNISQFDLERPIRGSCAHGDYLEIKNGATTSSPLIGQYCGKFQTKIITSLANNLLIHFHSDYYLTGKGFKLEWDGSVVGCGGTLTSSSGSISSPNYPDNYYENAECFYKIVTSHGSRIHLSFSDLDLEVTSHCRDDYVEIFNGNNFDSNSLGKYCQMSRGSNNIETTNNFAVIKFRSDAYLSKKGFLLNYFTICNNNLTGSYGIIESPGYPDKYPQNLNCLWNINVSKGNRINVTFTNFDIIDHNFRRSYGVLPRGDFNLSDFRPCRNDYLQWKETTQTTFSEKFCGTKLPPMISSTSDSLQIKFVSGLYELKTGFRLEWVRYGCGGHIQKRYGSIAVDGSKTFSDEVECEWLLETPIGTSITLNITHIFLQESQNCSVDVVAVYNGQNTEAPLLTKICNRQMSIVQSTSNVMLVKYSKRSALKGAYFSSNFNSIKAECGENFVASSGYIYSKNYPKNYDKNLKCRWIIQVPKNHRIQINFMDFDLYSLSSDDGSDCDDSIKIFDTENLIRRRNYTSIICPSSSVRQITTKLSRIMIEFTSNGNGEAKGFKANFSVTCGGFIKAEFNGIISNENYSGYFNKSCIWTIYNDKPDQKISLTITHLSLPVIGDVKSNKSCSSSFLRVFDGDDIEAPLIDEFCGKKVPPMIVSRGSAITVLLDSYINYTIGHFSAYYSSINEACGGVLTSEEGAIASPNYPQSYPIASDCEWTLSTSPGNRVYISFEIFDLEYSEGCNEDYLEIREDNGGGHLLGVYCGTEIPTNTTIASKLYIKFHSSDKNNGKGFVLHYGFLHGNELINAESGEIASPLYPHLYHGAAKYSWRIQANGTEGIVITINNFEIPAFGQVCNNYLSIYDGYDDTAPRLSMLCGRLSQTEETVQTSSNMALIKLSLDEANTGSQFHLRWKKMNVAAEDDNEQNKKNCGSDYTEIIAPGNFSMFTTPNHSDEYDNNLNCEWTFQTTAGRHLILRFIEFEIEETSNCFADYVNIFSSNKPGDWKQIKDHVCEKKSALEEIISENYLKVQFSTDSSIIKKGFQGKVSSMCGGLITDSSGEVGPIWEDTLIGLESKHKIKCEWTIKVRPGRLIDLQFKYFNLSNTDDNCSTSVILRNGDSNEAPLLAKYCGFSQEITDKLTTSSNSLYISYVSNYYQSRSVLQSFKIRYEEKNIECGTTSKLDSFQNWEIINSPNYPNTPVAYAECIWVFSAPPGEILRIDFIDRFDLDNVADCVNEFVELHDGSSSLSPSLGRFCGEIPGTIKTTNNALYVKYLSQISEPRDGFKANISIDVCGGTIISGTGEIKSPGYPHLMNIPIGSNCEWHIKGDPKHVFNIVTQDIDLPESETACATKVTIEEKIPGDNTATVLRQYCYSDSIGTPVGSSTNEFIIKYSSTKPSDWSKRAQSRGFRFTFTSESPSCHEFVTTPQGFITTPGYPVETALTYCGWFITVPDKTRRVRLELLDADAGKHKIGIYNNYGYQSLIQSIPSPNYNPLIRVYESTNYKMSILLLNPLTSKYRFKAKFSSDQEALCGGNLYGSSGKLSSPNLNRLYLCEWHYNSRVGNEDMDYNTILVTATVHSSVTRNRCGHSDTKLIIRAYLLDIGLNFGRELCGTMQASYRIPSSSIDLSAVTTHNDSLSFDLDFKAQLCGGTVNVGEDQVNILEIPSTSNEASDCAWIVMVPSNSRLELKMEGSFQHDCVDEFLNIRQGTTQFTPSLGAYCKDQNLQNPLVVNFRSIYIEYHTKNTNSSSLKLMAKTVGSACGGQLSPYRKIFSSPNYPKHYEPNQECTWLITADLGSRISLHFIDRFVVEDTKNCTKDAVVIYDWNDDTYNELARVCGRQIPMSFNSTYNKMKIVLRTDSTTNLDGFKASWAPICGGDYLATDKIQTLVSPGFPLGYPAMSDCAYVIKGPKDKTIHVTFLEFDLEGTYPDCQYDNVTISGTTSYSNSNTHLVNCGTELPSAFTMYNTLYVTFKSDRSIQKKGFKLTYQIYECGGLVQEPTLLSSHFGDGFYDNDLNCTWVIKAPENKAVVLKFVYIDLDSNGECYNDYIAVFNGLLIDENNRFALLCGHINSTTVLRSQKNNVVLEFVTDQRYSFFTGFKLEVLFTYGESVGCGGQFDLENISTRTLKSPLLGTSVVYENYLDCQWVITSPPDTVIQIEFVSFHISSCYNVNQTALGFSKCDCDYVEIKDGLNPDSSIIGTYCGLTLPPTLHSSANLMTIRLTTDGELVSSGFEIKLSVQQSLCGKTHFTVKEEVVHIKSPDYDRGVIPRSLRCVYYLDAPAHGDTTMQLSIIDLDLQSHSGTRICDKDKLIVSSNPSTRNVSIGKYYILSNSADSFIATHYYLSEEDGNLPQRLEYCGSIKSSDVYLTGSVTLTIVTSPESDSKSHKGIHVEFAKAGFCGRNYTGTQGKIYSRLKYSGHNDYDDYQERGDHIEDCYTLITAPGNHTIAAYFLVVNLDYWNENVYLEVFDGKDTASTKMITMNKDYERPLPLFSTGPYLLLHSRISGKYIVQYEMNFVTTDKGPGCGGKIETELGRVTSPMYPDIYRRNSKCEWELETPIGTRLKLHFETFDLGSSCDQNYLQIVNSKGDEISSYCTEKPADYTSSDNYVRIVFYTTMNNGGTGWIADFVGIK